MNGSDDCTTIWMYLVLLVKMINLKRVYHIKRKKILNGDKNNPHQSKPVGTGETQD